MTLSHQLRTKAAAMLALALSLAAGARAGILEVLGFTLNPAVIISMYNVANQTNQIITEYPKDMDPAVFLITVVNNTGADIQPSFKAQVFDHATGYCGGLILTSPVIKVKRVIKAGERAVLNAADFTTDPVIYGDGLVCQAFYDGLKKDFESSNIAKAVDSLVKKQFKVCLVWCASDGTPLGSQQCTQFSLFTGPPGIKYSTAVLIVPHNHPVDGALTFAWAPAFHNDLTQNEINYDLEICDALDGTVLHRLPMQQGATFYSYSPSDPVLEADRQYWWRVVSKDLNGVPFGGPGNRGWNVMKWFRMRGHLRANLSQLGDLVAKHGDAATRGALAGYTLKALLSPSSIDDPVVQDAANGKSRVTSIRVIK